MRMMNASRGSMASVSHTEERRNHSKHLWRLASITLLAHMVLDNLAMSFGAVLIAMADDGDDENLSTYIMAPAVFCMVSTFFEPTFREASENWGERFDTRNLTACGIFVTVVGLCISSAALSPWITALIYGIFCGIGSRLALAQTHFVMNEVFYTNAGLVRIVSYAGESLGQLLMPFVITASFGNFGSNGALLIVACLVIQMLPLAFYVRTGVRQRPAPKRASDLAYTNVYAKFDSLDSIPQQDIQLSDLMHAHDDKTWRSPSDESLRAKFDDAGVDMTAADQQIIDAFEERHLTNFGVEILPQIAEESESEDDEATVDENRNKEIIQKYEKIEDKSVVATNGLSEVVCAHLGQHDLTKFSPMPTNAPPKKDYRPSFCASYCCCCCCGPNNYEYYRAKRRAQNFCGLFCETLRESALVSLKTWQFYPMLLVRACALVVPLAASCLLPLVARKQLPDVSAYAHVLPLALHGFGWLAFVLAASPCVGSIPKSKYKFAVAGGLFASAGILFTLMHSAALASLAPLSLALGACHGCVALAHGEALRELVGARRWPRVRDALERLAAVASLALALCARRVAADAERRARLCLGTLACAQGVAGLVVAAIPFVGAMVRRNANHVQWPQL